MKTQQLTGKGKRESNQDVICVNRLSSGHYLFLIVDGMGGYDKGDEAAKIISESIFTYLNSIENITNDTIQQAVKQANIVIKQFNEQNNIKSGGTLGGILITKDTTHIFWIGDVNIYQINRSNVLFQTKSHTLINSFLDSNNIKDDISLDKYNHIVTRSISGKSPESTIGYHTIPFSNTDLFIICSDGIHNIIPTENLLLYCKQENGLIELEKQYSNDFEDNYSIIITTSKDSKIV